MQTFSRKQRKIFFLFVVISFTTITLVVETYAWFVGLGVAKVSSFDVAVASETGLEISLNGVDWNNTISFTQSNISSNSYTGNTNVYPDDGLKPYSTNGLINIGVSRLTFYDKTSLTSSNGGFRLNASSINMTNTNEESGYIAFDLFIRNGIGSSYVGDSIDFNADEDIFLTTDSTVVGLYNGTPHGVENSVRVGFFELARIKSGSFNTSYLGMNCSTSMSGVTTLCASEENLLPYRGNSWNIWEPNSLSHTEELKNYYNNVCKSRSSGVYSSTACPPLSSSSPTDTYAVNSNIVASDAVDIYDGLNGHTPTKLSKMIYYQDSDIINHTNSKKSVFKLAGNSVTKVRIYIWLEGQDVDNFDKIVSDSGIRVKFGFTKDKFNLNS